MFCSKCGKEISDEVKFCSHCGAKIGEAEGEVRKKDDHPLGYKPMGEVKRINEKKSKTKNIGCGTVFLVIIGIVFIVYLYNNITSGSKTTTTTPKTTEELRKDEIGEHFSAWDGSHIGVTKFIKKSMNDPSSYKHVETKYWDKGDHLIVKTTFRGKNAFGGVVKNWVMVKVDLNGNVIEVLSQG